MPALSRRTGGRDRACRAGVVQASREETAECCEAVRGDDKGLWGFEGLQLELRSLRRINWAALLVWYGMVGPRRRIFRNTHQARNDAIAA
jgi:hypothetical protein